MLLFWRNSDHMIYIDASDWMTGESYIVPDQYKVKIELIGGELKEFKANTKYPTILTNTFLFGDSNKCIPDGFYKFHVSNCGVEYSIIRPYLYSIECRLLKFYKEKVDKTDPMMFKEYVDLKSHLDLLKVVNTDKRLKDAQVIYDYLDTRLKFYNCGC